MALASTLALGGYALAQMGPGGQMGPGMMGGMMRGSTGERPWISIMLDHRDDLGLSDEQVGKLFSLRDGFEKEVRAKSAEIQKAEQEFGQLVAQEPLDLAKAEAKLKEIEAMRTALRLGRLKTIEAGKGLLTPEQRKKLGTLGEQARRGEHRSMMAPEPGVGSRGMEAMREFMESGRMGPTMESMMEMPRGMGGGDTMLGMVRMMEMMRSMGRMGGMMGGPSSPGSR
jgi:Spy/CpxP family protein refolding chaperone